MPSSNNLIDTKYQSYINAITAKRINILMPISFILLVLLIYSDIYLRNNSIALYFRLPSLLLTVVLFIIHNYIKGTKKKLLTKIYNIFLVSILFMMYGKYILHFEPGTNLISVFGILIAIFILSIELKTNLLNTILYFLMPYIVFLILFYFIINVHITKDLYISFADILLFIIVGFFINYVQNDFRYKAFYANYLLNIEKDKLQKTNAELNVYQEQLTDLVEEKTLSLQYALDKAKESDKLKTLFLQNISHEIRSPINAVTGFIELLSKKDKGIEKEFNIINENFNILINTIENILFLSKLQVEGKSDVISKFQLCKVVDASFKFLKKEIKKSNKNIVPILEFDRSDKLLLRSNFIYIYKILELIIDNAIKFSNKDGEIIFSCYKELNKIIFQISDRGQGISEDDLPFIFESFRKFEDDENIFRGIGIGLTIAKELVDLLSGEIFISSKKDEGTVVQIQLKL